MLSLLSNTIISFSAQHPIPGCDGASPIVVSASLNGGVPDPSATLNATASAQLCATLATGLSAPTPTCRVVGFTGWRVNGVLVRGHAAADRLLLGVEGLLSPSAAEHIAGVAAGGADARCAAADDAAAVGAPRDSCQANIVGPDDPQKVVYDVATDDHGCFGGRGQGQNNCYDYGCDVVTNTFAQPGRGSGQCSKSSRPCMANTCDDVRKGAESDGLTWVGTELPTSLPSDGHYVSLHIWPQSNFHWIRAPRNYCAIPAQSLRNSLTPSPSSLQVWTRT